MLFLQPGARGFQRQMALKDLITGLSMWRLWTTLGWNDIRQRYRRSLLGPLWLTASMAIMVLSLGVIYANIFKMSLAEFMPFLCIGLLVWGYVSSILNEAGTLFIGSESYIKQMRLPYSLYVFRFIWGKIIIFAHNFVIYFAVLIYFQIQPGSAVLYAIPGFLLLTLNGILISLIIGMASARFRDIPQVILSLTQIVFFITPIIWKPTLLKDHPLIMDLNPFFHLFEIARLPLLGEIPTSSNYLATAVITILNLIITTLFFVRFRSRISYWV